MGNLTEDWINIQTSPGVFSDECAASIKLFDGRLVSLFVNEVLLRDYKGQKQLKVWRVRADQGGRKKRVLLPFETFETGSRWIEVPA